MQNNELRIKAASVLLTPQVKEALERFARDDRRSKSSAMELAVLKLLQARGYLPAGTEPGSQREMEAA